MIEVCGITIQPNTPESLLSAGHEILTFIDRFDREYGLGKVPYTAEAHEAVCAARSKLIDAVIACTRGCNELIAHGFTPGEQIGATL